MKFFEVKEVIRAKPEVIWALLTDAPNYPSWNPTITKLGGTVALGEKLEIHAKISPDRAFTPTVSVFEPNALMKWTDGMPLGLFKGERTYKLTPVSEEETEFFMREEFTGLLSPLIGRTIPDMSEAFQEFAAGLKKAAEG